MTEETLRTIILVITWIAAISTTSFPLLYSCSPWRSSAVGRLLMFQAIAFAFAVDLTLLTRYWSPLEAYHRGWLYIIAFGLIAASTASLTYLLWHTNHVTAFKNKRSTTDGEYFG